ncbi:STAS domain-containing protein [Streptomyces venezuelae]|uniref:STAS domain-containing protein n=1 Tax=Streptomyces venezuelae TaxID=54571 RepID=UPI00278BD6AF|nr:STAS domain-containing protein [Streptomyces venezuelae]
MNSLTLTTRDNPAGPVITLSGEMDLTSRASLEAATRVTPPAGAPLCLDMSGVTFMDSSGLNFLLTLRRRLTAHGSRLVLTGIRDAPMRVLALTGADAVLLAADDRTHVPTPGDTPTS